MKRFKTLSSPESAIDVLVWVANEDIRNHIIGLCQKNNFHSLLTTDLEELAETTKRMHWAIVFIDYQVVNTYGARIYSRINVSCPECSVILLCDRAHRDLIKEAMELGVYACILAPYEEWEVLTMVRNILTGKKKRRPKRSRQNQRI